MAVIRFAALYLALTWISIQASCDLGCTLQNRSFEEDNSYRLNASLVPLKYDIRLAVFMETFTFSGNVSIEFEAVDAVSQIVVHMVRLELDFKTITVKQLQAPHDEIKVKGVHDDGYYEKDFYRINLESSLKAGTRYVINFPKYTSKLNKDLEGFYKSSYLVNGTQRWLATTFFQPTNARQAFPCFDEPALKARFTISISRPEGLRAISNMPQKGQPQRDTKHMDTPHYWDHFEETPLMSTYLVAFVISDFTYLDEKMRIFAEPNLLNYTRYALKHTKGILDWMADYLGVGYGMPKLDQVAVPDFQHGAMENWGLAIYKKGNLLIDDANSPATDKQLTMMDIAHEIAHQWFGDLVSPNWWKYLWLSEGFATYFHYLAVAKLHPEWRLQEQFVLTGLHQAMKHESEEKVVHPLTVNVSIPGDIRSMLLNPISFKKGASVIRMVESIATTATFRASVQNYLKSKSHSSATDEDLFDCFAKQIQKDKVADDTIDIREFMRSWARQTGFPVLTVIRDYAKESATLTQKRFPLHPDLVDEADNKWYIPLTYTTEALADFSTRPKHWMRPQDKELHITGIGSSSQWILFNVKSIGYYRVNYDGRNWGLLTAHLKSAAFEKIPPVNRATLVHDAFNLARVGIIPYSVALNLSTYLRQETDLIPWHAPDRVLEVLAWKFASSPPEAEKTFEKFLHYLRNKTFEKFGHDAAVGEGHITRLSRAAAMKIACQIGERKSIERAIVSVNQWMHNPTMNEIDPDLREAFYCAAVRFGNSSVFDFFGGQQRSCRLPSECDRILMARGCSKDHDTLRSLLDEAVECSTNDQQFVVAAFKSVNAHPEGLTVTFDYVMKHFKQVKKSFGSLEKVVQTIYEMATKSYNPEHSFWLSHFLSNHSEVLEPYGPVIRKAIEVIDRNNEWYEKTGKEIVKWIKEFFETLPSTVSSTF